MANVAIIGAGCIGSFIAGSLQPHYQGNADKLLLVGRQRQQSAFEQYGIKVTDYLGHSLSSPAINFASNLQLEIYKDVCWDLVILTVKCTDIEQVLPTLTQLVTPASVIVCLQNGIGSEALINQHFPNNRILTGIVGFNVIAQSSVHFHRGTEGEIIIEALKSDALDSLVSELNQSFIETKLTNNIEAVRWGKLLLNLNNSLNALTDIPLKEQLANRQLRRILADAINETLLVLKATGIKPAKLTHSPVSLLPYILKLPNWLFSRIANKMLAIDPLARSSMWYDLSQNKPTEINYINGAVAELAKRHAVNVPVINMLIEQVNLAQQNQQGSPGLSAKQLLALIK